MNNVTPAGTVAHSGGRFFSLNTRQVIKVLVYGLLLVNFVQYIHNDITIASHTVHAGWTLKDWTTAFATTLDITAWLTLLLLLELETYLLSDEAFTRFRVMLMHGIRIVCFLAIGHTVFAFSDYLLELKKAVEHIDTSLCEFANQGLSFARNLEYWNLSSDNCASLSTDTHFYQFAQGQALTDRAGMSIEWDLAWIDLFEVIAWLVILSMIELMVRLQEKGITGGPLRNFAKACKTVFYIALWVAAAYWGYRGHWMFVWDVSLWILGFMAIGMNLSEWRKEIEAEVEGASSRETAPSA